MKTILFMPTMRCNLKCPVCHFTITKCAEGGYSWRGYERDHHVADEVSGAVWIAALRQLAPFHLEFSGGEPLLHPGFREIIAALPDRCSWAITSNTLLDVGGIDFSKCRHWTASYHNTQMERFVENLKKLRGHVGLSVSIVAEFNAVDEAIANARSFKRAGYQVNVLRELNPGVNWTGTPEWGRLVALRGDGFNVVESDIPPSYEFDSGYVCSAGMVYLCAMPDGSVYPCYSQAMLGSPMAHVLDFAPNALPGRCHEPCLGCALDHQFRLKKIPNEVPK